MRSKKDNVDRFPHLDWPRAWRPKPDQFDPNERDAILSWFDHFHFSACGSRFGADARFFWQHPLIRNHNQSSVYGNRLKQLALLRGIWWRLAAFVDFNFVSKPVGRQSEALI